MGACTGNNDEIIDFRRGVYRQIIHSNAAHDAARAQDDFPLEESAWRRLHDTIVQRLPVGPAPIAMTPYRLLNIAGTSEYLIVLRAGIDLDAAKACKCACIEHVARVFMRLRFAEGVELAGVAGADNDGVSPTAMSLGEAQTLLRFDVSDVCVIAVLLDTEDVSAIAADGKQAVRLSGQRIDDVVLARPDLSRGLVFGD